MRKGEGAQKSYKESYRGSSQSLSKNQTEHVRFFLRQDQPSVVILDPLDVNENVVAGRDRDGARFPSPGTE